MKTKLPAAGTSGGIAHRAFALIELLVVISVIGLIAAILVPSLFRAKRIALAAKCASNLHHISTAFEAAVRRPDAPKRVVVRRYPGPLEWPGVPFNVIPTQGIYLCPEDLGTERDGSEVPGLQWRVADRDFTVDFAPAINCLTRKGQDSRGAYTEFVFEENWAWFAEFGCDGYDYPNCSHRTCKDAVFRVYDNRDGSITLVLVNKTTMRSPPDQLLLGGKVRWASLPSMINKPDRIMLPNGGFTSYGINPLVARPVVTSYTAILVDYTETFVDLVVPDSAATNLVRAARHLGRMNVLFADHSVQRMGPSELDPRFNMDIWSP